MLKIEDADATSASPSAASIMSSISGVKPLQQRTSMSNGELPRFGVEVPDEELLSQVRYVTMFLSVDLMLSFSHGNRFALVVAWNFCIELFKTKEIYLPTLPKDCSQHCKICAFNTA
jgi:hypothetical protein